MISFKHRFHGHNGLRFVYAHGKTVRTSLMSLRFAENNKNTGYRCAVIVSKKISKSAVVRNRIRRRIYETIRRNESLLAYPADMVVTVFSEDLAIIEANLVEDNINKLLIQAKLLLK